MFRKIITFTLLLIVAASCKKADPNPDFSAIDKQIIEDYLGAKKLTAQSTSSGLYYIITVPGGTARPNLNSSVTAYYNGYLASGTVFDHTTTGNPLTFPLANVIAGWQEGLRFIGAGGKIKLLIPSALGYGGTTRYNSSGAISIPMNSVIIFDIEMVGFTK